MFSQTTYQSKYQILALIGQGQYGRVYCAAHRQTEEIVALKELDRKFPTRKFLQELGFMVSLQHPNLVGCQGLEYSLNGRFLIMDYCKDGTLRDLMESKGKLDLTLGLKLIANILSGLEYIRERNIVHRDLKPENILLDLQDVYTARITDFGIARFGKETQAMQMSAGDTGSPAYMAPEQFYGRYSHASDLYAVGIMLFEIVTGDRPFAGTFGKLQHSHLNQTVDIPNTVPFLLRSTIAKALKKLPQRRFATAGEMLKSIQLAQTALRSNIK